MQVSLKNALVRLSTSPLAGGSVMQGSLKCTEEDNTAVPPPREFWIISSDYGDYIFLSEDQARRTFSGPGARIIHVREVPE